MLDINLFRVDKGGNPEIIRESQRRRYASVEVVDEIIHLDQEWRKRQFELDNLRKDVNKINKQISQLKISGADATEMIKSKEENKQSTAQKEAEVQELKSSLYAKLETVGNLVHDSVPISNNEENNAVIRTWGEKRTEPKLKNHVDLVELLGIADTKRGTNVAGGRGFYLKGDIPHCIHHSSCGMKSWPNVPNWHNLTRRFISTQEEDSSMRAPTEGPITRARARKIANAANVIIQRVQASEGLNDSSEENAFSLSRLQQRPKIAFNVRVLSTIG